jgi:urea transport system substrate-binding protein
MADSSLHRYATLSHAPAEGEPGASTEPGQAANETLSGQGPFPSMPSGRFAHYEILGLLGRGGMGAVYQAEDTRLRRLVALKVMHPALTAQLPARERFLREARAMAAVRSDHVITIYEVDQVEQVPYLAMELLQGQTLEEWLKARGAASVGEIVRIGREIAAGLAAAHARGLIHRDIKPANVWLEAPIDRVKILDFGLARPADNRTALTRTGDVVGTPHYMAPEQARGEPVDGRSDLFSLGVVLYRLCTGELPFRGDSVMAVLTALAVDEPAPIRECNPQIPPELDRLVMQLLEKDPGRRPAAAVQVVDVLAALDDQTLKLGRPGLEPSEGPLQGRGAGQTTVATATISPGRTTGTPADLMRSTAAAAGGRLRRPWLAGAALTGLLLLGAGGWWAFKSSPAALPAVPSGPPIRIGVLQSTTGTMAISERPILDGVVLAIEEINDQGGLLGRPVEAVFEDGQSDERVFARKAASLIEQEKVCTILGCWTSASRRAVETVIAQHDLLLLYPVFYEGMEQSPYVVYGGSVPNQYILPALKWCYGFQNKKRWFLVGSDSIFPRAANAVIHDLSKTLGTQIVGEEYLPAGSHEVQAVVQRIVEARPDLIVNTINGDSNIVFFRALGRAGFGPEKVPTLSFTVSEQELSSLRPQEIVGDYAAGNYFPSIELPQNLAFLERVEAKYGAHRIVTDQMQTAYALVHLWAQAIRAAGTDDVRAIRKAIAGQTFDSPQGLVTIDPATLHTIQVSRVGRINEEGRFIEVYASPQPIVPEPFPSSRSRKDWEEFLDHWYQKWGGHWSNGGS